MSMKTWVLLPFISVHCREVLGCGAAAEAVGEVAAWALPGEATPGDNNASAAMNIQTLEGFKIISLD
jgi:hypothetical protein